MTTPMHGIVLCAGLGTRLRPLTQVLPKPVVPVGSLPAALRNAEQLLDGGIRSIHMNTHYLAEEVEAQVRAAALSRGWPVDAVRFWNEPEILETGGGIARIIHQCSQELSHTDFWDTIVVSGDIVADVPLKMMMHRWAAREQNETSLMASVALTSPRKDVTWVSSDFSRVAGFGSDFAPEEAKEQGLHGRIFSNHQILSGRLVKNTSIQKLSSIDLFYRASLARGEKILHTSLDSNAQWFDIGTPESYIQCADKLNLSSSLIQLIAAGRVIIVDQHTEADHSLINLPNQTLSNTQIYYQAKTSIDCMRLQRWRWLGHMHACPALLQEPISALAETINENFQILSETKTLRWPLIDGAFLNADTMRQIQEEKKAIGFFDLNVSESPGLQIELPHPVMVRLDVLGLIDAKNSDSELFWLLIH